MIDFEKDIKITPEDIEIQNRLRRERRPLSMDEYVAFLKFSKEFFDNRTGKKSLKKPTCPKVFEL
jgi:hypothetical protein